MKKIFRYTSIAVFALSLISSLTSCDGTPENDLKFTYDTSNFTDAYGSGTNSEAHPYETIMVQPTENPLRDDLRWASMPPWSPKSKRWAASIITRRSRTGRLSNHGSQRREFFPSSSLE